jgi:hypothetical protein
MFCFLFLSLSLLLFVIFSCSVNCQYPPDLWHVHRSGEWMRETMVLIRCILYIYIYIKSILLPYMYIGWPFNECDMSAYTVLVLYYKINCYFMSILIV